MFCPQCQAEYRAGFNRCSDCGISLVAFPMVKPAPRSAAPKDDTPTFFLLTFALTWGSAALLFSPGLSNSGAAVWFAPILFLLGAFAPSFCAVGLTAQAQGIRGVKALLRRFLIWRV